VTAPAPSSSEPHSSEPDSLVPADEDRRCVGCGYSLRALTLNRCPECGLEFDPDRLPQPSIPWLLEESFSTFVQTVGMVLLHPRAFGEHVWRDVDISARRSTRFRWITVGVACLSMLAVPLVRIPSFYAIIPALFLAAVSGFFFSVATGNVEISPFVPPPWAQRVRFIRLQGMSCAGLALSPLVPLAALVDALIHGLAKVGMLIPLAAAVVLLAWLYGSLAFQAMGGRRTFAQLLEHVLLLPLLWLMILTVGVLLAGGLFAIAVVGYRIMSM